VDTVIVDGEVVVENGKLLRVDVDAVLDNARRCALRLVGRPKERSLL
jgi:hypothetical protein